jgi:hypothetical protein
MNESFEIIPFAVYPPSGVGGEGVDMVPYRKSGKKNKV